MPTASPVYFWEADVVVETVNLAFSPQTTTEGRGALAKLIISADWLRDEQVWQEWASLDGIGKKTAQKVVQAIGGDRANGRATDPRQGKK